MNHAVLNPDLTNRQIACRSAVHTDRRGVPKSVVLIGVELPVHDLVTACLKNSTAFRLGRCYSSGEQALADISRCPPDLVLINTDLPGIGGLECANQLKRFFPRLPVIILASEPGIPGVVRAFRAGADGYLVKPLTRESLLEGLQSAVAGWKTFAREVQQLVVEHFTRGGMPLSPNVELTPTEHKIMAYLVANLSDKEIATATGHATATIHSITSHIYKKLGVHTRREAVAVYLGFDRTVDQPKSVARFVPRDGNCSTRRTPPPAGRLGRRS